MYTLIQYQVCRLVLQVVDPGSGVNGDCGFCRNNKGGVQAGRIGRLVISGATNQNSVSVWEKQLTACVTTRTSRNNNL